MITGSGCGSISPKYFADGSATLFSKGVEAFGQEGDFFLGLSTSGNSKNIIEAVKFPKEKTEKKDIEALLSQVEGFIKFSEDKDIVFKDGKKKLSELKNLLFKLIQDRCTIPLGKASG